MTMPERSLVASAAEPSRFPSSGLSPTARADHDRMANAIRALAMDAVEKANSGHPGLPMGAADIATVLFTRFLKFDPADPAWPDRDRFVLSAGHGSMLLYALLHLTGYEAMTIDELKRFRQLGSLTPGHPEHGHTPGVETTTGPLGQGLANAVGMAIAERHLAAVFGSAIVDHATYVLASDGDLMEGISQEAIALAGHLKLNKLIVLFDDNGISIDGPLALADSVDQVKRFEAAGWAASRIDGHDPAAIAAAIEAAKKSDRPSMIACRTTIGFGAPTKSGKASAHGSPLGADEIKGAREKLGWTFAPFEIPTAIREAWRAAGARGKPAAAGLEGAPRRQRSAASRRVRAPPARRTVRALSRRGARAEGKAQRCAEGDRDPRGVRAGAGIADRGAAGNDRRLGRPHRLQQHPRQGDESAQRRGLFWSLHPLRRARARHGGGHERHGAARRHHPLFRHVFGVLRLLPARDPARRADGPARHPCDDPRLRSGSAKTARPISRSSISPRLRAIPNLKVFRPCDVVETVECWQLALESKDAPSVLALTRQNLPQLRLGFDEHNRCAAGAYELIAADDDSAVVSLFATGSEVAIAAEAKKLLAARKISARVVSVPCFELFLAAPAAKRAAVVGQARVNVAVEAGIRQGWDAIIGSDGVFVGMTGFGASGPYKELYQHFGLTAEKVAQAALARLEKS